MVLESMIERGLYQSLVLPRGAFMIFLQKPISLVMPIGAALFALAPVIKFAKFRLFGGEAA